MFEQCTVVIIARNEVLQIERCLDSLHRFSKILVVDTGSSDGTVELVLSRGIRVISVEWRGYADARRIGLNAVNTDWVFFVDADEVITEPLNLELRGLANLDAVGGYEIPFRTVFLGKWIKWGGWRPDIHLRLIRKNCARLRETEIHEKIEVDGEVKRLKSPVNHYTVRGITSQVEKVNRYSTMTAKDKESLSVYKGIPRTIIMHPIKEFIKWYVLKLGFLDGWQGLVLAWFRCFDVLLTELKVWENRGGRKLADERAFTKK